MGVWVSIDVEFLGKRGIAFTEEYGKALSSMRLSEAADYTIKLFRLEEKAEDIIEEWLQMSREKFANEIGLKPFAKELLEKLKAEGVPMGVATTSKKELYMPALERNGVRELFDVIVDSDMVKSGKESPEIFLKTAELLGVDPKKCAVFEDTLAGLRSAASCGFMTIGMLDKENAENHGDIREVCDVTAFDFKQFLTDT